MYDSSIPPLGYPGNGTVDYPRRYCYRCDFGRYYKVLGRLVRFLRFNADVQRGDSVFEFDPPPRKLDFLRIGVTLLKDAHQLLNVIVSIRRNGSYAPLHLVNVAETGAGICGVQGHYYSVISEAHRHSLDAEVHAEAGNVFPAPPVVPFCYIKGNQERGGSPGGSASTHLKIF